MLRRQFDSPEPAEEYSVTFRGPLSTNPSLRTEVEDYHGDVERKVAILQSVWARLALYEEALPATVSTQSEARGRDIFVVHGHDAEAKQSVARFIEKLDLRAVILHEQASAGRTVVEKVEQESSGVGYAVVLLTPDDIGAPGDKPEETKRRARQNVVFELGFFVGRLGRAKVCVLHKGEVDIPLDFQGVIYEPMDEAGAWRISLAREMKKAGIDLDMNKVL
jgi:predicted nucleotide-binding protein